MVTIFFDVHTVYTEYNNLKKEDVRALTNWVKDQPHLPDINEQQAILFLHRWHYQLEEAKTAVDTYFTVKTYCSDMFLKRNPLNSYFKDCYSIAYCSVLPQKSHKGYSVFFSKYILHTVDLSRWCTEHIIRYFDIMLSLDMYENGPSKGYIVVFDAKNFGLEMVLKSSVITIRKFLYYMQKVTVGKFQQLHLISHGPYMNKIVALFKPFLEKELADEFYVHQTLNELYEHIPQNCLPKDYGGSEESLTDLHVKMEKNVMANVGLFDWEDEQIVDESKRHNKSTDIIDYLERGSIRNGKFEID